MPYCYSHYLRDLLIIEQLLANGETGKRWQYSGRAKEASRKCEKNKTKKKTCSRVGQWLLRAQTQARGSLEHMGGNSDQDNLTAKRHLSLVLSHTEPHISIYFLPVYKTASTLRLFIKTFFKFSCIYNILPDNISQYLFLTFLINDTPYQLYHK